MRKKSVFNIRISCKLFKQSDAATIFKKKLLGNSLYSCLY